MALIVFALLDMAVIALFMYFHNAYGYLIGHRVTETLSVIYVFEKFIQFFFLKTRG